MKQPKSYLMKAAVIGALISLSLFSCKDDDESTVTTLNIDKTTTSNLNIGETATATITIVADNITSFNYIKVVDNANVDTTDAISNLVKDGTTYTYNFSYVLQEGDDLGTLGFKFVAVDGENASKEVSLLVETILSVKSMFIKYDWHITGEDWLGTPCLTAADSAKVFRFNDDGTYDVDLSATYAASTHHFCYWVYKETPNNGDTIAELRLLRRMLSGETATDEYYDFKITKADETEMTMFWELWGLTLERTFKSKTKGEFQAYGTEAMATEVNSTTSLDCGNIDNNLLSLE